MRRCWCEDVSTSLKFRQLYELITEEEKFLMRLFGIVTAPVHSNRK